MSERTPGPWWYRGPSPGLPTNPCDDGGDYAIYAKFDDPRFEYKPRIIAEVISKVDWGIEAPALANAEFIVRACNSHDDLLAACEVAKRGYESAPRNTLGQDHDTGHYYRDEMISVLEAAIAKAKEQDDE